MDSEDFILNLVIGAVIALVFITFGVLLSGELSFRNIKIQDVKQMEDGYYVTIDDRIYYKGVE